MPATVCEMVSAFKCKCKAAIQPFASAIKNFAKAKFHSILSGATYQLYRVIRSSLKACAFRDAKKDTAISRSGHVAVGSG